MLTILFQLLAVSNFATNIYHPLSAAVNLVYTEYEFTGELSIFWNIHYFGVSYKDLEASETFIMFKLNSILQDATVATQASLSRLTLLYSPPLSSSQGPSQHSSP